jgi:hypothetical protein
MAADLAASTKCTRIQGAASFEEPSERTSIERTTESAFNPPSRLALSDPKKLHSRFGGSFSLEFIKGSAALRLDETRPSGPSEALRPGRRLGLPETIGSLRLAAFPNCVNHNLGKVRCKDVTERSLERPSVDSSVGSGAHGVLCAHRPDWLEHLRDRREGAILVFSRPTFEPFARPREQRIAGNEPKGSDSGFIKVHRALHFAVGLWFSSLPS